MHYYSLNEYLKSIYGEKVYKISLDGGMSCPNRDGTLSNKGCIFCSKGGSGEFSADRKLSVTEQIEQAKLRIKSKTDCKKFIAYFQPFTNTYAGVDYLRKIFYEAIENPEIVILSIATRPDCLGDDVIELLSELNKIKPVWVELGLQTIHKCTSDYIRRCYELEVYDNAVKKLASEKIQIITHIILGLPYETKQMMLESVKYAGERSNGIKLQLLHVLKDTDLLKDFENGNFSTFEMDEYIDLLCDCIEILPENVVIHRLTGDGDKRLLVSPLWSADKKRVLNAINKVFRERNVVQGKCLARSSCR
ncbi:MAG: TIGR01212 family radical SAM protein [Ruminococcus sp.]|nr:TIGR01212 family radical SAM protein [Ruminococcus sp.]